MAEATMRGPAALAPIARSWGRISPSLVPIMAVLTALIITIPFMILTGGRGDVGRGLAIAGNAYSALIEGALGIGINDQVSRDNLTEITTFAQANPITERDLRRLGQDATAMAAVGAATAARYGDILPALGELDDETLAELSLDVIEIQRIGVPTLDAMRPFIAELAAQPRPDVRALGDTYAELETLTPDARAAIEALAPSATSVSDADLLNYVQILRDDGINRLERLLTQIDRMQAAGIPLDSPAAQDIAAIATLDVGASNTDPAQAARSASSALLEAVAIAEQIEQAGVTDPTELASQIQLVRELYSADVLTNEDVGAALDTELDPAIASNTLIRRPGDRLIVGAGSGLAGSVYGETVDGQPILETMYLRLGGSAFVFFPENLEAMLTRAIPFIIAGLAVALGFKAGVFNIGAEGQLYAGGILAVWVGISPIFAGLPIFIHLPLMLVAGILGGFLWGAIPGALKAYTGAHEVIVTIMLNYIAIRLVDWLIKSPDPVILLDTSASTPRTPFINPSAMMPRFNDFPAWVFIVAGIVVFLLALWSRRDAIRKDTRALIRPVVLGVVVAVVGLFLQFINVRDVLHIGFIIMILAVLFTDWFLNRTTLGFELRTVGANSDAARYAGMNVKWNIVLALALGGALAGLAGMIEISAVQFNMQPAFFAGVGFDAISVALLARSNPRNMPLAGFLWGALLTGAGLMQIRADISIDLVKIIQALIIMFIAADAIIRFLWRVPETEQKMTNVFAKGWGG
ncbi:MAG: ABC transporter permease [Chloroflexota bacterium]|nr:ABC transporter permease [Chloroflexota bacterium]